MAADALAIINIGLHALGEPRVAAADETNASRSLNAAYDETLRMLLRDYQWGFATKRSSLTAGTLSTEEALEWDYVYTKPTDWLASIAFSETGEFDTNPYHDYSDEQNRILANCDTLYIKHTFLQTDTTQFDASFDKAFGLMLASESAYKVAASGTLWDRLSDLLAGRRIHSSSKSAQDQRPRSKRPGRFRRARMSRAGGLISAGTHGMRN
jgi:hypothetical protein